jgi:hypothetical protein
MNSPDRTHRLPGDPMRLEKKTTLHADGYQGDFASLAWVPHTSPPPCQMPSNRCRHLLGNLWMHLALALCTEARPLFVCLLIATPIPALHNLITANLDMHNPVTLHDTPGRLVSTHNR